MYIGNLPVPTASQRRYFNVFLASKQIVDIPGGYTPGSIVVFIDGDLLLPSDYTATNGTSVNLGSMYPAGTKFYMEEVSNFQIGDATTLGGVSPSNYARKDISETFASGADFGGPVTVSGTDDVIHTISSNTGVARAIIKSNDGSNVILSLRGNIPSKKQIMFGTDSHEADGVIEYDHDNVMRFYAGGGLRLSLTDNGNVLIPNTGNLSLGSNSRQMINLYSTTYGIGVQSHTAYIRSGRNFAWYRGGEHDGSELNAGGGTIDMSLASGVLTLHAGALRENRINLTTSINWSHGNSWTRSVSGNVTFTESNLPPSGTSQTIIVRINYTSGNITWPASWKWIGGSAPTLSAGQNFIIVTCDDNSNVFATYAGKH